MPKKKVKKKGRKKIKKKVKVKTKKKVNVKKGAFEALLAGEQVVSSKKEAKDLCSRSCFGEVVRGKVHYSLVEAAYLLERGKIEILYGRKKLDFDKFMNKAQKLESNFWTRFCVYSDIRSRGYIVKTALKFGADFRVYDRGVKPGQKHARWILFPVYEASSLTWHEFAAKGRVAHSTKKNLLIGIVDEEGDVTYYEITWLRP